MTIVNAEFPVFDSGVNKIGWLRQRKGVRPTSPMKKPKAGLSDALKHEFKKDLELFEYFLVLLNNSSPIRNVELMWAEDLDLFDPAQRPRVNTGEALVQIQPF